MNTRRIAMSGLAALLLVITTNVGALQPVEQRDIGSRSARNQVVIVSESSRYKERLIDAIVEQLDDGQTYIAVRSFDDFGAINPRDYDSVLVINAGVGAEVRRDVISWLERQSFDDNIVVLTTQLTNWTPQITVDSVTTASQNRNIPDVSADLVRRVRGNF